MEEKTKVLVIDDDATGWAQHAMEVLIAADYDAAMYCEAGMTDQTAIARILEVNPKFVLTDTHYSHLMDNEGTGVACELNEKYPGRFRVIVMSWRDDDGWGGLVSETATRHNAKFIKKSDLRKRLLLLMNEFDTETSSS